MTICHELAEAHHETGARGPGVPDVYSPSTVKIRVERPIQDVEHVNGKSDLLIEKILCYLQLQEQLSCIRRAGWLCQ
jgi:hypothetical protein